MKLSVIIPALNEEQALPRTLAALAPLRDRGAEIIVADGGSGDRTGAIAVAWGATVLRTPRGRAAQMNAGAAAATGDVLLFLHADTRLPPAALAHIERGLQNRQWGRFDVRIEGRPLMLLVVAALMNLRSRLTGTATGDQAMFMRREAFSAAGGFPDLPLMEDIEMSARLLKLSPPAFISARAITSGRRWEKHGVWRTIFLMWRLRAAYWRGVPATELARRYP
jgi:rSAM/selenodomain-associated transferase 2